MSECYHNKYFFNNRIEGCKNFNDQYLFRGISPYEVLRIINGVPLFFEDHIDRLMNTLSSKNLEFCFDEIQLKNNIYDLRRVNDISLGNIKILYNYYNSEKNCLIYFIQHNYPSTKQYTSGIKLGLFRSVRENPNAKLINKTLSISARQEKLRKNVYEVLLLNNNGNITEGSMSNVFFIKDSIVYTPPLESVLPGITRKYIISACENLGIAILEKEIHFNDLEEFDSVFITSTSSKVLPVSTIEKISFDPDNSILRMIMEEFDITINNYIGNFKR
ncbi:MAG: aminotransferase class IV [Bacteroidales bacterium]|nr:aminotransferase class IV [Bacteroidales bacterium]